MPVPADDGAPDSFSFPVSLPDLRQAIGPLGTGAEVGGAPGFVVAGRGAFATAMIPAKEQASPGVVPGNQGLGAGLGADLEPGLGAGLEAWAHPLRLATGLVVEGATVTDTQESAAGVERRLRVAGAGAGEERGVVERVVVPRDGPCVLLEWAAPGGAATVDLAWRVDLRPAPPVTPDTSHPGSSALQVSRHPRGAVVRRSSEGPPSGPGSGPGDAVGVYAFSVEPAHLGVEDGPPGSVLLRARLEVPAGGSVRLAMAAAVTGPAGDGPGAEGGRAAAGALRRALRVVERGRAVARAREGEAARLRDDRLALDASDPAAGRVLERAKARLLSHAVDVPGGGRTMVAGYAPLAGGAWGTRLGTRESVLGALGALAIGEHRLTRDVLAFLGRRQDATGRVPTACGLGGDCRYDRDDTPLYLLLMGRYLAWTGDLETVRREWPWAEAAYALRPGVRGAGRPGWAAALAALAPAAEAIGETARALEMTRFVAEAEASEAEEEKGAEVAERAKAAKADDGPGSSDVGPEGLDAAARGVLDVVDGVLGAEPDAPRGRLVLRPKPPEPWPWFSVRSLAMGSAAVALSYRRRDGVHRFRVEQSRGSAPVQLVLEPELTGGFAWARVDGVAADLEAVPAPGGVRVPVQLVLDQPRLLEVGVAR